MPRWLLAAACVALHVRGVAAIRIGDDGGHEAEEHNKASNEAQAVEVGKTYAKAIAEAYAAGRRSAAGQEKSPSLSLQAELHSLLEKSPLLTGLSPGSVEHDAFVRSAVAAAAAAEQTSSSAPGLLEVSSSNALTKTAAASNATRAAAHARRSNRSTGARSSHKKGGRDGPDEDNATSAEPSSMESDRPSTPGDESEEEYAQLQDKAKDKNPHHAQVVLAFLCFVLAVGMVTLAALEVLGHPVPYTAVIFFLGIVVGCYHFSDLDNRSLGSLSDSIDMWVQMDPHLMLFVFLPLLIFAEGMNLNWVYVKGAAWQCILLAFPGVLFGTALTAMVVMFVFPYGWDMYTATCLGAILSATDPVAVVALLKELGCSPILSMQIAGESLLNDGSAMIVWIAALNQMRGMSDSTEETAASFVKFVVGGPVFGLVIGSLSIVIFILTSNRLVESNHTIQLAITVLIPYSLFYLAENEWHMSGVLAVVVASICVARGAVTLYVDRSSLRHFWHAVEFIANTTIFMLGGVIVSEIFIHRSHLVGLNDWMLLMTLWLALIVIRFVMVAVFYPLIKNIGFGTTWQDCMVISWSGLRGAVGLALALVVDMDSRIDRTTGARLLFHTSGIVALTLLVNAPTCKMLVKALGLTERHWSQAEVVQHLHMTLQLTLRWKYTALAVTKRFRLHNPKELTGLIKGLEFSSGSTRLQSLTELPALARTEREKTFQVTSDAMPRIQEDDRKDDLDQGALQTEREIFLSMLRADYWDMIDKGMLQPRCRATALLLRSVDVAEADSHMPLSDWANLLQNLSQATTWSSMAWLWLREGHFLGHRFVPCHRGNCTFDVYTLICAIDAHKAAQKRLKGFHKRRNSEELLSAQRRVILESEKEVSACEAFLKDNRIGDGLISRVRTKQLAFHLLADQEHTVKEWLRRGTVNTRDAEELLEDIKTSYDRVLHHTGEPEPEVETKRDLVAKLMETSVRRASISGRRSGDSGDPNLMRRRSSAGRNSDASAPLRRK
eukprot:TRINITY_DN22762_c0_g1_i1.p1 TRINITY_DN22762_c0_g1~~TRINITY_DN22762_c0_g1_i1.p1  ORF type:complete len:1007 (-),score=209.27 TRINITY_DN22762_c0_g1_i1:3-3023(-)